MVETARRENCFLMEAIWTRFLPIISKTTELINAGEIGDLKYIRADFGFSASFDPQHRLFNPQLGGGALLDLGIYPLFLALLLMGVPDEIKSFSYKGSTGIDESTEASLFYRDGRMASLQASICAQTPIRADIAGSRGALVLDRPWYKGTSLLLRHHDQISQTFSLPFGENGFEFEIMEVHRCLGLGLIESPLLPLGFSLSLAKMMYTINQYAGISYTSQPI
jgi:predicted dehydrogenase